MKDFSKFFPIDKEIFVTTIQHLSTVLDAFPVAFDGNRLNLLFIEDAHPILNAREYWRIMDGTWLGDEQREYFLGDSSKWPFPALGIKERPDPWLLSSVLFERFDVASQVLPCQRIIGSMLLEKARLEHIDLVALMIVDGLSYYDLPEVTGILPCLVPGVTITQFGYREVIGKPSIAQRLFAAGYKNQIGISFFDPENNPLAGELYATFGSSQVYRVASFEEGIHQIKQTGFRKGYIQITAPGLDDLCHFHRDRPPRKKYIDLLLERFEALIDCLAATGQRVLACLTADHGILWREDIGEKFEVVGNLLFEDTRHPRYLSGSLIRDYLRVIKCGGQSYSLLRVPCLTRPFKQTEWGVHGGISAWESIVPLIMRVV